MVMPQPTAVELNPYTQIRSRALILDTPSLTIAGNEPVPEEILRDLLRLEWWDHNGLAPRPRYIEVMDDVIRVDPTRGVDVLTISLDDEGEEPGDPRGELADLEVALVVGIQTMHSRQRLHNLKAEIRRILYRWTVALVPYERLYYDGFKPAYEGANIYKGTCQIRFVVKKIPAIRRRVQGHETPATDPERFPRGQTA